MQIAFRRFKNIKIPGGQTPLGASRIRRPNPNQINKKIQKETTLEIDKIT